MLRWRFVRCSVLAAACWSVAGGEPCRAQTALAPGFHLAPDPARPETINAGAWRRMSRLGRLAAVVTADVLSSREGVESIPLFWGTGGGEFSSTAAFLRSLFTKGPALASPLAFQNSVHNAPAGHLSIAFGLRGPSETICAGPLTTLRTLERAMVWVHLRREPVLVVVADDLGPDVQLGLQLAHPDGDVAWGEGAAAFVLGPGEAALALTCSAGGAWTRAQRYPGEDRLCRTAAGVVAYDQMLGLFPAADAVALVMGERVSFPGWTLEIA